jgi:hypothetical protein
MICTALQTEWIVWAVHVARIDVKRTATSGFGAATREKDFICMCTQIYYFVLENTMGLHGMGL